MTTSCVAKYSIGNVFHQSHQSWHSAVKLFLKLFLVFALVWPPFGTMSERTDLLFTLCADLRNNDMLHKRSWVCNHTWTVCTVFKVGPSPLYKRVVHAFFFFLTSWFIFVNSDVFLTALKSKNIACVVVLERQRDSPHTCTMHWFINLQNVTYILHLPRDQPLSGYCNGWSTSARPNSPPNAQSKRARENVLLWNSGSSSGNPLMTEEVCNWRFLFTGLLMDVSQVAPGCGSLEQLFQQQTLTPTV